MNCASCTLIVFCMTFMKIASGITTEIYDMSRSSSSNWYDIWMPSSSKDVLMFLPQINYNMEEFLSQDKANINFGYSRHDGPDVWPLEYPECGGSRQSPINIAANSMLFLEVSTPIHWHNYWNTANMMTIMNNGHTVILLGDWGDDSSPMITGGMLDGRYIFSQLHFHWGTEDTVGSEHRINNITFPLEMHMVHYNTDYGSLEKAIEYQNGLVVASFLFQISEEDNSMLDFIVDSLAVIEGVQLETQLPRAFPIGALATFSNDYISYSGSLTTPPCSESVTWIVSTNTPLISRSQLSKFRKLMSGHGGMDVNNFRPIQPHNSRPVYYIRTRESLK